MHGNAASPLVLGLLGLGMLVSLAVRPVLDARPAGGPVPSRAAAGAVGLAAFGPAQVPMPAVVGDATAIVRSAPNEAGAASVGRGAHRRSLL